MPHYFPAYSPPASGKARRDSLHGHRPARRLAARTWATTRACQPRPLPGNNLPPRWSCRVPRRRYRATAPLAARLIMFRSGRELDTSGRLVPASCLARPSLWQAHLAVSPDRDEAARRSRRDRKEAGSRARSDDAGPLKQLPASDSFTASARHQAGTTSAGNHPPIFDARRTSRQGHPRLLQG